MQTSALTYPAAATPVERLIRCVSSGYLSEDCSCQATVPSSVASDAWARELARAGCREDQFFRFAWRGGEWLGYGLRDGRVRGVYCPEHSARRAQHSSEGRLSVAS